MKLSIVIICWNDLKVIKECLASIYRETTQLEFEVIISDNGSTDDSLTYIQENFPQARLVRNGANLGFAKGNNAGIRVARGEYVLILNPDTIIHDRALERLVAFADRHPEGGAFGCQVLNPDGSDQLPAVPLPTPLGSLLAALYLRWPGRLSPALLADSYPNWDCSKEQEIGRQSGCCILVRGRVLAELNGFDEQFFYHCEETDLCCRIWKSGSKVLFFSGARITHLGGQSVGRFPVRFALETYRSRYRYFYKHFGRKGAIRYRWITLLHLGIRRFGYTIFSWFKTNEALQGRLEIYRVASEWNRRLDPLRFVQAGEEPDLGYQPMAPAPVPVATRSLS